MTTKQFAPDANPATGAATTKKEQTVRNIPVKDADFNTLAQAVAAKWKLNP